MLSSVCDKSSRSKQLQQIGMSLMEEMKGEKLQGTAGMSKDINKELWHACAGPLVSLPYIGSLVYYFPQGHTEQVATSTRQIANTQIPNYPSLPSQLLCQVDNLTLHADKDTDEIFAQLTLRPIKNDMDLLYPPDFGQRQIKHPSEYFCKTLTASDTSTHGGFSVPRRAAEKLFPPLDFSMQPPTQELVVRDLHGNTWTFRHIYRGQPKRHLLTTGWSLFIGSKRLKAGDSVLFIRDSKSQLLLGVRRANRQQTTLPSSVLSADSMHMGVLAAAAHAAANHCHFTVFYNPRACPSEFVVSVAKIEKALFGIQVSVGMRFGMMFETEESGKRRYMGSIVGVSDIDPVRWPNSKWRTLQVEWDEPCSTGRHSRINIWDIDTAESPVLSSNLFRTLNQYQLAFPGVQDSRNCSTQNRVPFMQGSMEAESNLATVCKVKQQPEQGIPGSVFDGLIVPSQSLQMCVRNGKRVPQDMSEVPSVTSKKLHQYVCKQQQSLLLQNLSFPNTAGERHVPGSSSLPLTQIETSERAVECSAIQAKNSVEVLDKTKNQVDGNGNEKKATNDSFIDLTAITGKKPISRTVTEPSEDEIRKRSSSPTVWQESQQFNANLQVTSQLEKPLGNTNDSLQLINELLLQHGSPSQFQMLPQAQNKEKYLDLQNFAHHAFDASELNSGMQLELQQGSQILPYEDWMPHSGFLQSLTQVLSSSEPAPSYMTEFDRSVSLNPHDGKHVAQYVMETNPLSQDPNLLNFCSTTGVLYPKMTDMGGQQGDINMACLSKVVASSMDCNNQLSPFAGLAFEGNDARSLMDHSASSSIIEGYKVIGDNCFHNISEGFFGDYSSSQDLQSQVTGPADSQAFSVHEIPDCSEIMAPCGVVNDTGFMNNSAYQQASLPVRTYTKVQKAGSVGRSIDVTRFKDYDELQRAIAHMFGLEWEQYDSRGSGWKLVYTDYENDVLLVGDDPWEEFVNCVRCIRILSQSEIQQMSQEGIQLLHSASKLMSADP